MARHVRWVLAAWCMLLFALALTGVRANGDGREYVLMARAFARHGTPDIRQADVAWLVRSEPFLGRVVPAEKLAEESVPATIPHVVQGSNGRYYSLHFWLYSLLAVPFVWITEALGVRPLLALTAVNASAASGMIAYLVSFFRGTAARFTAPFFFLGCGTLFYLRWPGPEVLTAAAVLVATLSGLRGNIGIGMLAAGVAGAQNPSAAGISLLVGANWLAMRLGWLPSLIQGSRAVTLEVRQLLYLGFAAALLILPYAFFGATFGLPSLIARLATDPELIGFDRAWSLLFDLNQGLFPAMPGLLLALLSLSALGCLGKLSQPGRSLLLHATLVGAAVVVMLVPTLSIHNWNSGGIVVHRYCTWLCMPLLGAVLALLSRLAVRPQRYLAGAFAAAQAIVVATNGLSAEPTLYLQHGTLARHALQHWPSGYNPIPEIFIERTIGKEVRPRPDQIVVWPRGSGAPKKILIHETRLLTGSRGCRPGQIVLGASESHVRTGWRYVNAPFRCTDP